MITLHPTKIVVHDYERGDKEALEKALSVWDITRFEYKFSAFMIDEVKNELILPRGIDKDLFNKYFSKHRTKDKSRKVNPWREVEFSLKSGMRDNLQREAIDFLVNNNSSQKYLCLPTGTGKTYCSIHYVYRTRKLPMVFVDSLNLIEQWKNSVLQFTTIKEDEIYIIRGKESLEKLEKMDEEELSKYRWFIAIHKTIASYMDRDLKNPDKLLTKLGIGTKLYDEAHVEYKNTFYFDCVTNTESIYITATPSRSNHLENVVYQRMFKSVPRHNAVQDSSENYHNVILVNYNSKPSIEEEASMKNKHGFDTKKWCSYIIDKEDNFVLFTDILLEIINRMNKNRDKKIFILFHTIAGIDALYKLLKEEFPDLEVGRFDSTIKNKDKRFLELKKDIVLSTEKSFGKAIDVEGLDVLINTVSFGSKVVAEQTLGRLRKKNDAEVWYIDFSDNGFKSIKNQFVQRRPVFNKKAKKIYKLDYTTKNK
jgi:superfamily II DNA or RNA helicase